jgi:hypothetical protein
VSKNLKISKSAFWFRDGDTDRLVRSISGLFNSYDETDLVNIDRSCARTVYLFNKLGFKTEYHCSGVDSEHKFWDYAFATHTESIKNLEQEGSSRAQIEKIILEMGEGSKGGYISFDRVYRHLLTFLPDEFCYEESPNYKKPGKKSVIRLNHYFSDTKKIKLWRELNEKLKNL